MGTSLVFADPGDFAGGDGSPGDPFQVATAEQLDAVRGHLDAHFVQTAAIDLGVDPWNKPELGGWVPIGTSAVPFAGGYDGGGFTIANLTIRRTAAAGQYQGLFGSLNGATVRHLSLTGAEVAGYLHCGILVGNAVNSWIESVSTNGSVSSVSSYVGGVVGHLNGGRMHRAHSNVSVQGKTDVGGLVGAIAGSAEMRHCSARGAVAGETQIGGLVGQTGTGGPLVSDCYSWASATGDSRVGGLIGYGGSAYRSYSSGAVSGPEGVESIGGLIGQGGNVRDCFWDVDASGRAGSAGGEGLTTAEMGDPASFRHFNFHSLWEMDLVTGYPDFQDLSTYAPPATVALESLAGSGTPEDPYIVTDANELNAMRLDLTASYRLGNDIDLRDTVLWDMGRGWTPVGISTTGQRFSGRLDGGGFTITRLALNRPLTTNQGLIGYAHTGAVIENLRLSAANLQTYATSGLLAGTTVSTRIERVSVEGVLVSSGYSVGGLVGVTNSDLVHRAHANAVVRGVASIGGLVGNLAGSAEMRHCSARGAVAGETQIGGLVGQMGTGGAQVSDCYSRAAVDGDTRVGGLVGYLWTGGVTRSYSTGLVVPVSRVGRDVGGLSGQGSSVIASYWDIQSSGQGGSGGGEGRTTSAMTYPHASDTYLEWDFDEVWAVDAAGTRNGGYPYLRVDGPDPQFGGPFTLSYHAGAGGRLAGPTLQGVEPGTTAGTIFVLVEPGAIFTGWSDGSMANPRTDENVNFDIHVVARFQSAGGVDIDWYAGHAIAPGEEQTWADLDGTNWLGKGMTLWEEFLADTDPNDLASVFAAGHPKRVGGTLEIPFDPSSPERLYTLWRTIDMVQWDRVAGQIGIPGGDGPMVDAAPPAGRAFYRIEAGVP